MHQEYCSYSFYYFLFLRKFIPRLPGALIFRWAPKQVLQSDGGPVQPQIQELESGLPILLQAFILQLLTMQHRLRNILFQLQALLRMRNTTIVSVQARRRSK